MVLYCPVCLQICSIQAREPIKQAGILEGRIDGVKETCLLVSVPWHLTELIMDAFDDVSHNVFLFKDVFDRCMTLFS